MARKHFLIIIALFLISAVLHASTLSSHTTHAQEEPTDLIVFYSQLNDDDDSEIYTIRSNGEGLQQLTDNNANDYDPSWSASGNTIMFTSQRDNGIDHIFTMSAEGKDIQRITDDDKYYYFGHLSPDETQIMYVWYYDEDNPGDVHIMNRDGSNQRRLTDTVGDDTAPRWSPDGQQIAFMSDREGNWEIYTMNIDGSNVHNLTNDPAQDRFPTWSPDGTQLAFHSDRSGNYEIFTMDTQGNNIHQITDDPSNDARAAWSSDGTRLIFNSNRDGDYDLYSINVDGSGLFQILNEPGVQASADVVAQPATVVTQTDTADTQPEPLDTGVQVATEAECENFVSAALSQTRDNEVLLFADDFSTNCQDWLQDPRSQSIQDGKLYLTVDNGVENVASPSSNNADNAPTFTGDYAIEFTVSEFSGDSNLCVAIGFDRQPIGISTMFQVCPVGTVMFAYDEANWEFPPTDFSTGEHHFRLEVSETNKSYRLLLNGNEIANFSQSFTRDTGVTNGGIEIGLTRRGTNSTTYGSAAFDDISIWTPAVETTVADSSSPAPTNIIPIIPVEESVKTLFTEDFSGNSADWEIHNDIRYLSTIENGRLKIQIKNAQRWAVQVGSKDRSTAPLVAGDYEIEFTVASFAADTDQVCFAIQFDIRTGHAPDEFALCQDGEWMYTQGESVTSGTYTAPDFSEGGHRIRLQVNQDTYTVLIDDAVAAQISSVTPTRGSLSVGITRSSDGPGTINASAEFDDVSIRLFQRGRAAKENVDGLEIFEGVNQQQVVVLTHEDIARGTLSGNSGCGDEPQALYLFYGYEDHPLDIFMSYTVSSTDPAQPAAQGGFVVVDIQAQSVLATGQGLFTVPITFSVEDFEVPADGFYGIAVSSGVGFGCLLYDLAIYSEPSTAGEIASSTTPSLDAAAIPTSESIIFTSRRDENAEIYVMNPDGTNQRRLTSSEGDEIQPAPSPDGTRIAFNCKDGQYGEICVMNIDGSNRQNLTNDDDDEHDPTWSPDSSQIAFIRDFQIFVMNADGSGQHALSEENFSSLTGLAWSPDGTQLAFSAMGDSQLRHLFLINTDGSNLRELTNVAGDNAEYFEPAWSPDGSRIAFRNFVFENNSTALLIINADGSNLQTVLSNDASVGTPAWSPDSNHIIFHLGYDIYSINVDGTNLVRLTDDPNWDTEPEWLSPSGVAEVGVETAESTSSSTALPAETPVNVTGTPSQPEDSEPQQTTLDTENAYFVEDFSDNSADWEIGSSPEYTAKIENGRYSIELHEGTGWLVGAGLNDWNKAPTFSGQYEIVFNVANIQSNTDNYCIVTLFHLQANYASFKRLSICGNGEWLFADGEHAFRDSYDPVDFLNGETYQIKVQVTPATVKAYVNDALVSEVWIQSRASGSVGFGLTRIGDNSPVITASAEFDDLIVREIRTVSVADANTTPPTTMSEPTVANETATPTPASVSVADANTTPQPIPEVAQGISSDSTPQPVEAPIAEVIYQDSFEDNEGNWSQSTDTYSSKTITEGKFVLNIAMPPDNSYPTLDAILGSADPSTQIQLTEPYEYSFDFTASYTGTGASLIVFFDAQTEVLASKRLSLGSDNLWILNGLSTGILHGSFDTPIFDGQLHTIKVSVTRRTYDIFLDGQPLLSTLASESIGGSVGFGVLIFGSDDTTASIEVDNVSIRAIVEETSVAAGNIDELIAQGIAFRDEGDYLNALRYFSEAAYLVPNDQSIRDYGENLLTDYFILSPLDLNGWDDAPRDTSPSGPIPEGYDYNYPFALCGEIPVKALFIGVGAYEGYMSDGSFERASVQSAISFHRTPEEALETYNALLALFDGCTQGVDGFSSSRVNNASEIGSQTASYEVSVPISNFLGSGVMLGGMVIWTEENFVTITLYADTVFTFDVIQEIETTSQFAQANYVKLFQALSGN